MLMCSTITSLHMPRNLRCVLALVVVSVQFSCAHAAITVDDLAGKPDPWFKSDEGRRYMDNIISWQNAHGGWWKAYDATTPKPAEYKPSLDPHWPLHDQNVSGETGSFDNYAT